MERKFVSIEDDTEVPASKQSSKIVLYINVSESKKNKSYGASCEEDHKLPKIGDWEWTDKSEQINQDSLKSDKSISALCYRLFFELKKKPQTREELAISTGFARQRICAVISIFKAIGLVVEVEFLNSRKVEWNRKQESLLPLLPVYMGCISSLRVRNEELEEERDRLNQLLKEKDEQIALREKTT